MDELALLKRKLERERLARKQAENILESKALELFNANESLQKLNQNLELQIESRTKSLAASEQRYRMLVEQAKDLIYNIDKEGYFLYVNSIGIQQFGYADEDIIGKRFLDFMPEEDHSTAVQYYEQFKDSSESTDYHEYRVKSADGRIFWLGQNVTKVFTEEGDYFFTAVARDITKRKMAEFALEQAQLSLRKSEIKYRSIIENMELGLMEVNTDGTILRIYDRFNQMLGYTGDELVGKNANEILLVKGFEKVLEQQDSNRLKGETGVYEVKLHKKDGSEIWVLISGAPFYDEHGQVTGSIGVHYNITDRKELQAELEIAKRKAVRAQQAEKAFLANMSHEIRTPLNAIIGMSHLLQDTPLNPEQKDYLEVLSSSTHLLKSLISDILDISKIDAGSLDVQMKAFQLKVLAEKLISIFKSQNDNSSVQYILDYDDKIHHSLISDHQLINQVLLNLLSNASKFTNEGSITLSIQKVANNTENHQTIRFSIIDTGIGISEEDCRLIFEEFKQANATIRAKYGGTGLGLTISNQLVKLLGGSLQVQSKEQQGSTFSFDLTLETSTETVPVLSVNQPLKAKDGHQEHSILIVEDNAMNLKYISSLLNKWNLSYEICENGKEAFDKAMKQPFDIIFMDLQMPIMDGFEATQCIRSESKLNKNTPIIALTASTFLSKKRLALKAGMSDFLSKPFTPDQLSGIIDQYLYRQEATPVQQKIFHFSENLDQNYLNQAYGQDLEYALDMFQTFMEIIEDEMILISDTIEKSEKEAIKKSLHRMKPTFKMVGLSNIFNNIEQLEQDIENQSSQEIKQWFTQFKQTLQTQLPFIEQEIKHIQSWLNN